METPTNEPVTTSDTQPPPAVKPLVEASEYNDAAQTVRQVLQTAEHAADFPRIQKVIELLQRTASFASQLNAAALLRAELDQAAIQNQLLQQMLGAGSGESLADEQCGFIGEDDVPCTNPPTQLLIDTSGQRCPVCEEHARTAPPGLTLVGSQ